MLILGLLLILVGSLAGIGVLTVIGEILAVIGLVLILVGYAHGPVFGDRRFWW